MQKALITGGSGFFGGMLKRFLLAKGFECFSIDRRPDIDRHERLRSMQVDIADAPAMHRIASEIGATDAVFHCAAVLAHAEGQTDLWSSNVTGTKVVASIAEELRSPNVVFLSSNCLWGKPMGRPIREDDEPAPVEEYGRSKLEGEKILLSHGRPFITTVLRCPTIVGEGRAGLLSLLFEFIREGRRVWIVGRGETRYQFIAAKDLADACLRSLTLKESTILHIGSDDVPTVKEMYAALIRRAGTNARVAHLPKAPAILAMQIASILGLSPLGPYHYRMIAEDFQFDTSKIRRVLGWKPTLGNTDMLWNAYEYYCAHRCEPGMEIPAMGLIKILKAIS